MSYNNISTERAEAILKITIERPDFLNALNKATIAELGQAFKEAEKDPEVRVIILTGSGNRAFVAGADIKEFCEFNAEQGKELSAEGHRILYDVIENLRKPVIAAINGFALGGGLELALCCHIRVASDNAKLGLPEVSLGIIPGYGGTQRLAHLAGKGIAFEMIMTGQMIPAEEARTYGLLNHLTTQEDLMGKCEEIAAKIMKNSPLAISSAINAINAGYRKGEDGYKTEIEEFGKCFGTEDFKEGTAAFLEKREAAFPGK